MMRSFFFLFFLLPFYLVTEWDQLFLSDEDPTVFHHVNVMSGHLNISIEDTIHKINPEMVWLDVRHSEAGVIVRRAFNSL